MTWVDRARAVLLSESTKLRSLASTRWTALVAAVTALGGSAVLAFAARNGDQPFDPVASIYFAWLEYPVLAVGVLGVLTITAEHSTGLILTTFAAVPRRRAVLAGKATVVGGLTLVLGEVLSFTAFFLSNTILDSNHRAIGLDRPGVPRAVLAAGLALSAVAVLGVALGAIIRHTAGAIVALPTLLYLPLTLLALPSPWDARIGQFTPLLAADQLVSLHPRTDLLTPGAALLVLLAWPAVALIVASAVMGRDT